MVRHFAFAGWVTGGRSTVRAKFRTNWMGLASLLGAQQGLDIIFRERLKAARIQEIDMNMMKKNTLLALATSAVLAAGTLAPSTADARCRGCGIAAGVFGGLLLGSAIAHASRPYPYYAEPAP